ncbi:MAG: phospholipase [Chitinophagaceae bacterium]|nr:MAG: phospholipase [Chitinophagaceae bacterium]
MKGPRFLLLLLCFCNVISVHAQPSRFARQVYVSAKGDSLRYRLMEPDYNTARRYPLVIFLHGSGERGSDNEAQLKWGVHAFSSDEYMSQYPAYVLAPQCPDGQQWANFTNFNSIEGARLAPNPTRPMELVMALVKQLCAQRNIDTTRIYITGVSMGGMGTFDALQRYPKLFAAGVPVCGGGDLSGAPIIAGIPVWIYHGAEDPAVLPAYSLQMVQALVKAGAHPGFTLLPEVGHFSWIAAYNDRMLLQWLFRQHK